MRCKSLPKSEASYRTVNEKTFIFFSLVLCSICWSSRISIVTHVQTMHIIVLFKLCHLFILWGFTKRDWIVRAQHWHINTQDLCRAHFMCVCVYDGGGVCNAYAFFNKDARVTWWFSTLYLWHRMNFIHWNEFLREINLIVISKWIHCLLLLESNSLEQPIEAQTTWRRAEREKERDRKCVM